LIPDSLQMHLLPEWYDPVHMLGSQEILESKKLALFCSRRCPGNLILKAYDLARSLREDGVTVISGFHTPVEKECLRILLRGSQPIIISPARSIEGMRIPSEWKQAFEQNRLLLISPFEKKHRRMTAALAEQRNQFIASIADDLLFIHAAIGSQTEQFARNCLQQRDNTYTLDYPENQNLFGAGIRGSNAMLLNWPKTTIRF